MESVKIYKKVKPRKWSFIVQIIVYSICLAAVDCMAVFGVIALSHDDIGGSIFMAAVFVLFTFFFGRIALRSLKLKKRMIEKKEKVCGSITYEEFVDLQKQADEEDFIFKTFYLLEKYMYVPKVKLLIKYDDIADVKTIVHYTNNINDSARLDITDKDNLVYQVWVRNWKDFLANRNWFYELLNIKMGGK